MDRLARLHLNYVILNEMHAPKFLVRRAAQAYNDLLNTEFDRLKESWPVVPDDFLKPTGCLLYTSLFAHS